MFDYLQDFEKHREIILETIIDNYGEDKRDLITKRFNSVFFDFDSFPVDEYKYSLVHSEQFSDKELLLIKNEYIKFQKISDENRKIFMDEFSLFFLNDERLKDLILDDSELFISLFTDNYFNKSYIDALTSDSIDISNNPKTPLSVKNSILNVQKEFFEWMNLFGIEGTQLFLGYVADLIVDIRKEYKAKYEMAVTADYELASLELYDYFNRKFGITLDLSALRGAFFFDTPFMSPLHSLFINKNDAFIPKLIKIPVAYRLNRGFLNCDVILLHEIIHAIENDTKKYNIGINLYKDKIFDTDEILFPNKIANELRTHMLAMKITKQLHEMGIFIFDDPNNYFIKGGSHYDELIPFVNDFFYEFEDFINDCAINGDIDKLYSGFGRTWNILSKRLEEAFSSYIIYNGIVSDNVIVPIELDDCEELFEKMRSCYYRKYGDKIITKKRRL